MTSQEYQRKYYEAHREQVLERGRQRVASGASRAAGKRWYDRHVEAERQRNRERMKAKRADPAVRRAGSEAAMRWYETHRELLREPARAEARRAYMRSYIKTEKGRAAMLVSSQSRRARKNGAFVEQVDPAVVFERDRGICGICTKPIDPPDKWHVDHVVPLAKGGAHSYHNTQPAHAFCNISKGAKLLKRAS